jgi:hypothetical protein
LIFGALGIVADVPCTSSVLYLLNLL